MINFNHLRDKLSPMDVVDNSWPSDFDNLWDILQSDKQNIDYSLATDPKVCFWHVHFLIIAICGMFSKPGCPDIVCWTS